MKAILKISIAMFCCFLFLLFSCSKKEDPEARKLLDSFKNYVDTVLWINDNWKKQKETDSFFVEKKIDPNNPSKTIMDSMIISPTKKKTVLYPIWEYGHPEYIGYIITYKKRLKAVEPFIKAMNESMKKEFENSKNKFELLLPPKNVLNIDNVPLLSDTMKNFIPPEVLKRLPPEVQKQMQK